MNIIIENLTNIELVFRANGEVLRLKVGTNNIKSTLITPEEIKRHFGNYVNAYLGSGSDEGGTEPSEPSEGGTNDYEQLTNKPQINGVTLDGNKTAEDLNLLSKDTEQEITGNKNFTGTLQYKGEEVATTSALTITDEQAITTLATSGTINLVDNTFNRIVAEGTVTFVLPTVEDNTTFHEIFIQLSMDTVQTIDLGTTWFFNKKQPDLSSAGYYNLVYEYDGTHWVVSAINKGEVA